MLYYLGVVRGGGGAGMPAAATRLRFMLLRIREGANARSPNRIQLLRMQWPGGLVERCSPSSSATTHSS